MYFLFSDPASAFSIYNVYPTYVDNVLIWTGPDTNIGQHYDNTTGKYSAPHNGTYVFQLHLYKLSIAGLVACAIIQNGNQIAVAQVPSETVQIGAYESSTSAIVHLQEGDKVWAGNCANDNNVHPWTAFNGFLLYKD